MPAKKEGRKAQTSLEYLLILVGGIIAVVMVWMWLSSTKTGVTQAGTEAVEVLTGSVLPMLLVRKK